MTQTQKKKYIYIYIMRLLNQPLVLAHPEKAPPIKTKRICIQKPPRHRLLTAAHSDSIIIYYLSLSSGYVKKKY